MTFLSDIGLETFIGRNQKAISLVDLKAFPSFLCFDHVYLRFWSGSQTIAEKCQLFGSFLPSIMGAINDSCEILFVGNVDQNDPSEFSNSSKLIDYLRDGLLPTCNSSHRYIFEIHFSLEENSGTKVIESILKMPQIVQCPNVVIGLCCISGPIQLPVKEIDQWLKQNNGVIGKKKEKKFLKIYSGNIENISGMCENLIEVLFIS